MGNLVKMLMIELFALSSFMAPVPASAFGRFVTVPAGTSVVVSMLDDIDSSRDEAGQTFAARLEADLEADGVVVARRGSKAYVKLVKASQSGRLIGRSELKLELYGIRVGDDILRLASSECRLRGKSRGFNTAVKSGAGAGLGAGIGSLLAGRKGAWLGASAGAGAGALLNVFSKGKRVQIPPDALLDFTLERDVEAEAAPSSPSYN